MSEKKTQIEKIKRHLEREDFVRKFVQHIFPEEMLQDLDIFKVERVSFSPANHIAEHGPNIVCSVRSKQKKKLSSWSQAEAEDVHEAGTKSS